ncbi:MAG: hypothetical protein JRH18_04860 [Deltaproteobacteria bacterium]|nr:hypothetical protein [Deltaproteobacteria bacterium]MBW1994246.1 hypothetical protein [Deltaproteobacteria bacterium]MBW2150975.1 hypothetical protein [Deltaproteobacteria bacterium]
MVSPDSEIEGIVTWKDLLRAFLKKFDVENRF